MNFSSLKNISAIYLYLASVISFLIANGIRDINITIYYFLILVGLVFFVFGFMKRLKTK